MTLSKIWLAVTLGLAACAVESNDRAVTGTDQAEIKTADPNEPNTQEAQAASDDEIDTASAQCGSNTCGPGTYCCNPSCGICVPFGHKCGSVPCGF